MARGIVAALVARARDTREALDGLVEILRARGSGQFLAVLDVARLTAETALDLVRAVWIQPQGPLVARDIVQRAGPQLAPALLLGHPPLVPMMRPQIQRLIAEHPGRTRELVKLLLDGRRPDDLRVVGRALVASEARGFHPDDVTAALIAIGGAGLSEELLLPLYRNRGTPVELRVAALEILASDRKHAAEVLKRRSSDLLEPAPIRQRLAALRKAAKASGAATEEDEGGDGEEET
jgi:hypothetical protein